MAILALLPLYLSAGNDDGKSTIRGTVTDGASTAPIEFATVVLAHPDSTFAGAATTDSIGRFSVSGLSQGKYCVTVSFIGYKSFTSGISVNQGMNDMGTIRLEPDTEMLGTVVVSARRPVIEQKFDKLVMNVAEAVSAEGSNGVDLLRKAPGVTVDFEGNVKLNGSAVTVWIDGRPSNLSGKELEALLNATDGTSIDRIEIMAHPSSKYDAAGSGGIINIVTKKNFADGLNGSVNLSYGGMYFDRYLQAPDGSVNLNYKGRKTNTFLNFGTGYSESDGKLNSISLFGKDLSNSMRNSSSFLMKDLNYNFRAGNDWYISEKDILGVIVKGNFSNNRMGFDENTTGYYSGDELVSRMESDISNSNGYNTVSANLNYTRTFDKAKMQELTLNADYSWFDISGYNFQKDVIPPLPGIMASDSTVFRQNTGQRIDIWSAKADYQQLFWLTGMLEAGLKWSRTVTDNNALWENLISGAWKEDENLSDSFMYDEQIAAAYISAAKSFGTKWTVKIGLRGEYTFTHANWENGNKSYFNLFPTVFVSYLPTQKWRLSASYTRRINRPGYSQLNPFRTYLGTNSYMEGNPDLNPQFSDMTSLGVGFGQHLNLSLMYQYNSQLIMQTPYVLDDGSQRLVWENFGTQHIAGGSLSLSELPIAKWLNLSANYFAAYNGNINSSGSYSTGSFMQSFYANVNFLLPKDWKIEVGGFGSGKMDMGYLRMDPMYMLFAGVKKNMWDGRGTIALNVNDILRSFSMNMHSETGGVTTYHLKQKFNMQKITLSFSYRFGQNYSVRHRNVGNVDEASRAGSSSGIGTGQTDGMGL